MYRLSERSLAVERGRYRQTWLPTEDRLYTHCTQQEVETQLYFLTTCQLYQDIRDINYLQITTQKHFENIFYKKTLHICGIYKIQTCKHSSVICEPLRPEKSIQWKTTTCVLLD